MQKIIIMIKRINEWEEQGRNEADRPTTHMWASPGIIAPRVT
jgi:hypothetical protein